LGVFGDRQKSSAKRGFRQITLLTDMHSFAEFWREIRQDYFRGLVKSLVYTSIAVFVVIAVLLGGGCLGFLSELGLNESACVNLRQPAELLSRYLLGLPVFMGVLTGLSSGVIYLEWDKYKRDKPSGFIYGGWLNPNRPWVLNNLDRLAANTPWRGVTGAQIQQIEPDHSRVVAEWTDQQVLMLVQGFVRRLTSILRKPVEQRDGLVRWHILANSGDELHIILKRLPTSHGDWVLSVDYHEWVGRTTPARLRRSVVTEFVCVAVAKPVAANLS